MSKVIGIRLGDDRLVTLNRAARALGRSPGEMAGLLVEEGLRLRDFPGIEFRDTPIGRQAFVAGTRLGIWQVVAAAEEGDEAAPGIADALGVTQREVAVALAYGRAYPDDIAAAIEDSVALNRRIEAFVSSGERPSGHG